MNMIDRYYKNIFAPKHTSRGLSNRERVRYNFGIKHIEGLPEENEQFFERSIDSIFKQFADANKKGALILGQWTDPANEKYVVSLVFALGESGPYCALQSNDEFIQFELESKILIHVLLSESNPAYLELGRHKNLFPDRGSEQQDTIYKRLNKKQQKIIDTTKIVLPPTPEQIAYAYTHRDKLHKSFGRKIQALVASMGQQLQELR